MTAPADVLAQAEAWLGEAENPPRSNHTGLTERYADLSGIEWMRRGNPWCAAGASVWLTDAGLPTLFHYCPTWVAAFKSGAAGTWLGDGSVAAEPGDVVFFSFGGKRPDHVGIVRAPAPAGAKVATVEANIGDKVAHQLRSRGTIVGFGRPHYAAAEVPAPVPVPAPAPPSGNVPHDGTLWRLRAKPYMRGQFVRQIQTLTNAAGCGGGDVDGVFGPDTKAGVVCWQRKLRASGLLARVDGVWGPKTDAATHRALDWLGG